MKVNSICIVGGGSAGWMTAAAFSKLLKNIKVTLVESPEVPRIGVGESTIQEIHLFLEAIDVKDYYWMKECDASFKIAINFTDFYQKGTTVTWPFLKREDLRNPFDWLEFKNADKNFNYQYGDVLAPEICAMVEKDRLTTDGKSFPKFCVNREMGFNSHAYQLDAVKFAHFLRDKVGIPNGVCHILDHVTEYNVVDDRLKSIKTKEGKVIEADLFIDCTGYRSSILEGVFKTKHIPYKHLFNDAAVFGQVSYTEESKESELHVVTDCTGLSSGWVWNVPLWSRIGTGYVYSSKHIDKEKAELEFINHISEKYGHDRIKDVKIRSLETRNGRHENAWVSNVVAIGLSYGFIEPLESTGLHFVQHAILHLARMLKMKNCSYGSLERHVFNKKFNQTIDNTSWWVAMHFFLTKRDDSQYWRDYIDLIEFNEMSDKSTYMNSLMDTMWSNEFYNNPSFNFIAYNMGVYPTKRDVVLDSAKKENFIKERDAISKLVDTFPTHYELLRNTIYK